MNLRESSEIPFVSVLASNEDYAAARKLSWIAKSDRGYEVLTHDNGWAIMSGKQFDIGGGMGLLLDQVGITEGRYRDEWNKQIVCHEGEKRAHMRTPYMHLLKPTIVAKLQELVRDLINSILDDIKDPTDVDFLKEFAFRVPTLLFCELVSAPREMEGDVLRITSAINPPILALDPVGVPESEAAYFEGLDFMRKHIDARRDNLGDDFTSELIRCEQGGMVTPEETVAIAMSLLIASMDNTMHQIGLTFGTLLEDRFRWEKVLAKPSAAPQAAEETFRLLPRFGVITRHASEELTVDGFTFPAGSWIAISTRSAGRDELRFDAPDEFRLDRPASKALQFGGNHYSCLGATLARLEISQAIKIIAERFPNIHMIGDWKHHVGPMTSEAEELRVSLI